MVIIMSFDWKEFHDVGDHLESHSQKEAYQRSAVGRYYYSCYHLVKDYFEKKYFSLGFQDNPHKTLIDCLKSRGSEIDVNLADAWVSFEDIEIKQIIIRVLEEIF